MIAGFEGPTRAKGMFFEQIRERISFLNSSKAHLSRKKESERTALEEANQLIYMVPVQISEIGFM